MEADNLGYDVTESKKYFKQAEPSYRAGDYGTVINFAHDVEESVNAVLGGKRMGRAPTFTPRYGSDSESEANESSSKLFNKQFMIKILLPILGLVLLVGGSSLAYIAYDDGIWNLGTVQHSGCYIRRGCTRNWHIICNSTAYINEKNLC
jgi:hypothetical protein